MAILNTDADVKAVIRDICFNHFRIGEYGIWLSFSGTQIIAHLIVPDRDNPDICIPLEVERDITLPIGRYEVLETCRTLIHFLVGHELDECLTYRGFRIWDPHVRKS